MQKVSQVEIPTRLSCAWKSIKEVQWLRIVSDYVEA